MAKEKSRYIKARNFLIFWTLFIGIGAVAGAAAMLLDPSGKSMGMDEMLPYFEKLPLSNVLFKDFVFSGFALLIVNGITNITAAVLLFKNKKAGMVSGGIFGITLMLWIGIQFYMFPTNFMSTAYFIFGICQAITGYITYTFYKQEKFTFNSANYNNVGKDKSKLVVYFSRMGYVKKVAYEYADKLGADLYEITTNENIGGTLGFWWCGRFGVMRSDMPINTPDVSISCYDEVIVCSPIWVFSLAAPVRTFLKQMSGKINNVSYVFVHYTNGHYKKVALSADKLLGLNHKQLINVRCRTGKYKLL